VGPVESTEALSAAATLGPYFAVEHATRPDDWLPLTALTDRDDTTLLNERVAVVRAALARMAGIAAGAVELRAAASIHALALCSRLVAPALGTASLTGTVLAVSPDRVRWSPVASGPVPMYLEPAASHASHHPGELAQLIHEHVIEPSVAPVVEAFAHAFRLSRRVLWGNVASALSGSVTMIGHARPDHADRAREIVAATIDTPRLKGSGAYSEAGAFTRTNCCLYYRIPGGGYCGDCILRQR
jgi:ferric iron reductase protein FhuF